MVAVAEGLARYPFALPSTVAGKATRWLWHRNVHRVARARGDEGARRVVARFGAQGIPVDDPGVLFDVDTQDDFSRLAAAPCSSPS